MNKNKSKDGLILSVYPATRGFGYTVFKGEYDPIEWGFRQVKGAKNAGSIKKVHALIHIFKPSVVLLEDYKGQGSNHAPRIEQLIDDIEQLAAESKVAVSKYSRVQIRECFERYSAATKQEVAETIAFLYPEFLSQVPHPRRIWCAEDYRTNIFDAVSLVLTHFHFLAIKSKVKKRRKK